MKHISLYESFRTGERWMASSWPKKGHYRGVRFLRELSPEDDSEEITDLIRKYREERDWFASEKYNPDNPDFKVPRDVFWYEIIRPDGKNEIIFFDDFESGYGDYNYEGFMTAETLDGKYEFTVDAIDTGDGYELNLDTLDW
jgi:hypothetical protein